MLLRACCAIALIGLATVPGSAQADRDEVLNLWVSYYFTDLERYGTGEYRDALVLAEKGLAEAPNRSREGELWDEIGQIHHALGNFEEAKTAYRNALDRLERSLGRKHREIAHTLNNLADLHYILGEADQATPLYRRALDILERDQLNIEVCRSLNGLALLANDRGEHVEAENLLKRAVTIHGRADRRDHPYAATVLTNLGILYINLQRYAEAEPVLDRAKYIQSRMLRENHPDVAVRLHATAALYAATGRAREGAKLSQQADAIRGAQQSKGNLY